MSIPYEIRRSARARTLHISVFPDGRVEVVVPEPSRGMKLFAPRYSEAAILKFLEHKRKWIVETQEKFRKIRERNATREKKSPSVQLPKPRRGSREYTAACEQARALVTSRLPELNEVYGLRYGAISIRNQSTRWGSCSAGGNLSFNYRIVYVPTHLQDYLLVHELCHIAQHNHSPAFWREVAKVIPHHRELRAELRRYRF